MNKQTTNQPTKRTDIAQIDRAHRPYFHRKSINYFILIDCLKAMQVISSTMSKQKTRLFKHTIHFSLDFVLFSPAPKEKETV